jgi:hypothetical protein
MFLAPLFLSLFVCSVNLDFPCFLSDAVVDRLGPRCLFSGIYPLLNLRGLRPLVDGSFGRRTPGLFLLLFHPSHLDSFVCLFIEWTSADVRQRYNKFSLTGWVFKHSQRATSSGRLELRSSSSRPTLRDCLVLCSCERVGVSSSPSTHFNDFKLQKPTPIESHVTSHDPFPVVHDPSKWKAPSSPDSVPSQYVASGPTRSMV